jgi:hypothetical protein
MNRPEICGILKDELTVLQPFLSGCNIDVMTKLINDIADRVAGEWVSVEDRLPPVGIEVLCVINGTMGNEKTNMIVIDNTSNTDIGVIEFVKNYSHNYTYWRMLPQPIKTKEGIDEPNKR